MEYYSRFFVPQSKKQSGEPSALDQIMKRYENDDVKTTLLKKVFDPLEVINPALVRVVIGSEINREHVNHPPGITFISSANKTDPIDYAYTEIRPKWKPSSYAICPPMAANVAGRLRVTGLTCSCQWERDGYEKVWKDRNGEIIKKENILSISDPDNNSTITLGTVSGEKCSCSDPNGVLQPF